MTEDRELTQAEREDLATRLRALPAPRPDREYRERVRAAFTSPVLDVPAAPAGGRNGLRWAGVGIAAAAALLLAFLFLPTEPSWEVLNASADGTVWIDGEPASAAELVRHGIPDGSRLRVGEGLELTLGTPGALSLVIGEQSEVSVAVRKRLLGASHLTATVHRGVTWGTTGEAFEGLRMRTDQAEVRIDGTTFAVSCGEANTCVCVLEGEVEVTDRELGTSRRVPAQQQLFVYTGPEAPELAPLTEAQTARLEVIRSEYAPR